MPCTDRTLILVMVHANAACPFTETELDRLRQPVLEGITRPEAWRREQLQHLRELVTQHEPEILEALRHDLAKPDLEGMAEVVTLLQELKLAERRLRTWMRPRRIRVPLV